MATSELEHPEEELDEEPEEFDPTSEPLFGQPTDEFEEEEPSGESREADEELSQPLEEPGQPRPVHPDNYDFLDLSVEERDARIRELAEQDPDRLARGLLRDRDYREKTDDLARQRELLETQRPAAEPVPEAKPPPGLAQWAEEFEQREGRQPTQADLIRHLVKQEVQDTVRPLETQFMETSAAELRSRLEREYEDLCEEFPYATDPKVRERVAGRILQMANAGVSLGPGIVNETFWAVYGPQLLKQQQHGSSQARQQQTAQRGRKPALPVAGSGGKTRLPETSDMGVVTEAWLKQHPELT